MSFDLFDMWLSFMAGVLVMCLIAEHCWKKAYVRAQQILDQEGDLS